MDENYSDNYLINEIVNCIAKETINVPAGSFECYNINYGSNSLWYSSDVGNIVKSLVDETTENSTFSAVISLEAFNRNTQPVIITEVISPQEAFIYSEVIISGQATDSETGDPINNGNIFIEIPAINDGLNTNTDEFGNYILSIDVPLIFDDTPAFDEFESVGVIVECNFQSLYGYHLNTLVIIADYPPEKPIITGSTEGDVGTSYTYNFNSVDMDGDDLIYIIDWGDGSTVETVGPAPAGMEVTVSHTWNIGGTFKISAKAKDEIGAESDISFFNVKMPRKKAVNDHLLILKFNNFRLLKILKNLF